MPKNPPPGYRITCKLCEGEGNILASSNGGMKRKDCPNCQGTGWEIFTTAHAKWLPNEDLKQTCMNCKGTGIEKVRTWTGVKSRTCAYCNGAGVIEASPLPPSPFDMPKEMIEVPAGASQYITSGCLIGDSPFGPYPFSDEPAKTISKEIKEAAKKELKEYEHKEYDREIEL